MKTKKVPYDGIIADVVFVIITVTLNRYSNLIAEHIEIIFWTIGILQSLTIYAIMLNFDFNDPEFEKLPKFINSIMGLIFVLAAGGFLYIALADLLPELNLNNSIKRSTFQILFMIAGILLMWYLLDFHILLH